MKQYKEASDILDRIKKAKRILLSTHVGPDPDSVGSNLAMYEILKKLGKDNVEVISPDRVPKNLAFLPNIKKIKNEDITKVDLSGFDLFISLDAADPYRLTENRSDFQTPANLTVIVIDHHTTNSRYGAINLVDEKIGSTGELLYHLFRQWKVDIGESAATSLLTGIVGDSVSFRHATTKDTLKAASDLMEAGAPFGEISFNLYGRIPVEVLKFWGVVLSRLQIENVGTRSFVWVALPFSEARGLSSGVGSSTANMFLGNVEGVDFGVLMSEREEGKIGGNLRSRTDVDVAEITSLLGGGGHKAAAGFKYELGGKSFEEGVSVILDTIKDYLRKNEK